MSTVAPAGHEVLVVGAGPTGLALACELYRHGVACRLIDKGSGPSGESRALAVHSRTLEAFEDMGLLEPLLQQGRRLHGLNLYADGTRVAHVATDELDAPYPFILSIPQSDTERQLIAHLKTLGGRVEWGVTLGAFSQDEDRVATTLTHADREEEYFCGWLAGCDGAHSAVREGLGAAFEGVAYEDRLVLADVRLTGALPRDEGHAYFSGDGVLAIFPLPGEERVRLIAQLPDGVDAHEPTLEWFQAELDQQGPPECTLSEPTWLSSFRIHRRMVDRYRTGQVLLCGDAAHIHSPVGGQGMNTGIQDAYNLGWKLALVAKGLASPDLLDSYHAERHPIAEQVLSTTDRATRAVTLRNPVGQALRNQLGRFLTSFEVVQQRIAQQASQLAVGYRKSPIVGEVRSSVLQVRVLSKQDESEEPTVWDWLDFGAAPRPGDRAPDVVYGDAQRLFEALRGPRHTLLLFDGAAPTAEGYRNLRAIADQVFRRYGERVQSHLVVPNAELPAELQDYGDSVLLDAGGAIHDRYGAGSECLYLIRPDNYVGFRAQPATFEPLLGFLQRIFSA